jgi:lipopolysaccharide/colanic/teichoic acid biosynthesis glycosyltransferase
MSAPSVQPTNSDRCSENLSKIVATDSRHEEPLSAEWLARVDLQRPGTDLNSLDQRTLSVRRILDVAGAVTLIAVLSPVILVVALLVKLTSTGPILYRQVRTGLNVRRFRDRREARCDAPLPGRDRRKLAQSRRQTTAYGKPFVIYKFRTMCVDAERDGARFAEKGDPRVTSIGRFLRKTRLDEVPQLWNVLKGEMSLVGPRPERPEFIEQLSRDVPNYLSRLGIKPGLTGLAQVVNGYDNDLAGFQRKVALDLLYLQNCCLWNDLRILIRTVTVVLTGKGAL